jgi:hypothetical protein
MHNKHEGFNGQKNHYLPKTLCIIFEAKVLLGMSPPCQPHFNDQFIVRKLRISCETLKVFHN